MARTYKSFTHNTQLSTSGQNIVDNITVGQQGVVASLVLRNTNTTTTRAITLHVVENGGTHDTGNEIRKFSILPDKSMIVDDVVNLVLEEGMTLVGVVDAGADVNTVCSGSIVS